MEKITQYQQYVQQVLSEYAQLSQSDDSIEVELSFDSVRNHYHIFNVGWEKKRRIYGCVIHVDIKDGKIWIQHDGTEAVIADEFLKLGVPKEDIVLAFHSPFRRQFTGFAVN
ncbi:FdxN element excision controlling factor protein [Candidatus Moduliflexus flocculans]|uniref:FdxN element excision controlling factor protein n=1 Tax=Candidatus Moduliflexus flocculans TaxID=1499966 RepID=A0A0S6VQK7_9BACT|nr:FdxN element excision controlling factor protein [Candidatus Moduliflexus flocculans]